MKTTGIPVEIWLGWQCQQRLAPLQAKGAFGQTVRRVMVATYLGHFTRNDLWGILQSVQATGGDAAAIDACGTALGLVPAGDQYGANYRMLIDPD